MPLDHGIDDQWQRRIDRIDEVEAADSGGVQAMPRSDLDPSAVLLLLGDRRSIRQRRPTAPGKYHQLAT